eukprot:289788-Rhodomonas_salina.1
MGAGFSELAPGAQRPPQVLKPTPVVGGGVEATKGMDAASTALPVYERIRGIHERIDSKFYRSVESRLVMSGVGVRCVAISDSIAAIQSRLCSSCNLSPLPCDSERGVIEMGT